jgi:uncharacterized OB-fold protein
MSAIHETLDVIRDVPPMRPFSQPFWEGTREKKLLLQYDPDSDRFQFYPRPASIVTGKRNLVWREVSGEGTVFSFTIARRARPPFKGHEPFFIAVVELPERVQIMGNLVNCPDGRMKIGLRVKPYWQPLADGFHLLMFQPMD